MAIDITKQKQIEEQAKKQAEELAKKEEIMRKNMEQLTEKQKDIELKLLTYENLEKQKQTDETNQTNDLYKDWLDSFK